MFGLEKLIEKLLEVWDQLMPFFVIDYYDRGVRKRMGIPKGVLQPGFHWKVPFADEILTCMVKATTLNTTEQSLTTADNISIVIRAALKYEIEDVETVLLEVNSPKDALSDMVQGIIASKVMSRAWAECTVDSLLPEISRSVKLESKRWGIKVISVVITDLAIMKSIRLLNTTL
jgi:regulator of protease activity HflC (stomatin/prohibitin superfamily)